MKAASFLQFYSSLDIVNIFLNQNTKELLLHAYAKNRALILLLEQYSFAKLLNVYFRYKCETTLFIVDSTFVLPYTSYEETM